MTNLAARISRTTVTQPQQSQVRVDEVVSEVREVRRTRRPVRMECVLTRILVVEDDHDLRMLLRLLLEDEGYAVVEAATGDQALERFTT